MTLHRSTPRWILALWLTASGCAAEPGATDGSTGVGLDSTEHERARGLFAANCALCHGERGDGRGVRRAGFIRPPRDLTNPAWSRTTTVEDAASVIRQGKRQTPMPAFTALDDGEIDLLARYVLWLGRRPPSDPGLAGPGRSRE